MAEWTTPNASKRRARKAELRGLPRDMCDVVEKFDPWTLYLHCGTGHRVSIIGVESFDGEVSFTCHVCADHNLIPFSHNLRGIDPDDLEECELPEDGEPTGAIFDWGIEVFHTPSA